MCMVLAIDDKNEPKLFKYDIACFFSDKKNELEELMELMRKQKKQNEELKEVMKARDEQHKTKCEQLERQLQSIMTVINVYKELQK